MFRPNVLSPLSTTTDYVNGYIFTNNNLSIARTDNGYYTLSSTGTPTYHFYLKDHQGNNRVVVSQSGSVEQINHYYPYGALFAESTNGDVQRFKYNGLLSDVTNGNKELDRKFGLNWYDHGARHNDAAIGRWHSIDRDAEKYYGISPYAYCGGDPVNFGDYDGMDWYYVNDKGFVFNVRHCEENLLIGYNSQNKRIESITIDDKEFMDNLVVKENEMSNTYTVKEMKDVKNGHGNILYGAYYNAHKSETKSEQAPEIFFFMSNHSDVEWHLSSFDDGFFILGTEQAKDVIDFGYDKEGRIYKAHDHPNDINPEPGKMDIENSNSKIREYIYAPKTQTVIRYSGSKIVDKRKINVFKGFQLNF